MQSKEEVTAQGKNKNRVIGTIQKDYDTST